MRVITEERLRELLPWPEQDQDVADGLNLAIEECQEIDTLTVSKLRPMSEAPLNISILAKYNRNETLMSVCLSEDSSLYRYEGWLPIPIYEPGEE
jgi:hypothetical protein